LRAIYFFPDHFGSEPMLDLASIPASFLLPDSVCKLSDRVVVIHLRTLHALPPFYLDSKTTYTHQFFSVKKVFQPASFRGKHTTKEFRAQAHYFRG